MFRRRGFGIGDALSWILPGEDASSSPFVSVVLMAGGGILIVVMSVGVALGSLGNGQASGVTPIVFALIGLAIGLPLIRSARRRWGMVTGDPELLAVGRDGLTVRGVALPWNAIQSVTADDGTLRIRPIPGAGTPTDLSMDLFDTDPDEIIDAIAQWRIVDET